MQGRGTCRRRRSRAARLARSLSSWLRPRSPAYVTMPGVKATRAHLHPYPVALLLRRLANVFAVMIGVMVVATIGFVVLADYPWFDGLYMSVITLATIGYGEVRPLDTT